VYLTGGLRVEGPSGAFAESDLPGAQARVALAALVIERRPLSRDQLADVVWDERLPPRWTGALHTVISKLRSLMTAAGLDGRAVVASVGGTYAITLPPDTWVDLEDAHRRLDRAEGALRHDDLSTATAEATVASGILRRPLLAGIDGHWIEERRRHEMLALYRCYVVLAEGWLRRGDHRLAAVIAESAVELDPLRETGYRLLMQAEWECGDRAAALRALARCERVMAEELAATPSPETAALAERIRS
jgi:DNA-binding SARP family transcriptional activator